MRALIRPDAVHVVDGAEIGFGTRCLRPATHAFGSGLRKDRCGRAGSSTNAPPARLRSAFTVFARARRPQFARGPFLCSPLRRQDRLAAAALTGIVHHRGTDEGWQETRAAPVHWLRVCLAQSSDAHSNPGKEQFSWKRFEMPCRALPWLSRRSCSSPGAARRFRLNRRILSPSSIATPEAGDAPAGPLTRPGQSTRGLADGKLRPLQIRR